MLEHFKKYGKLSPQKQIYQFWKHDNHPFYLYSNEMINQKVNYIHDNPVVAGFVNVAHEWRLSSANENSPIKVLEL
jgi:putative transposase